jgi:hypothetical protein
MSFGHVLKDGENVDEARIRTCLELKMSLSDVVDNWPERRKAIYAICREVDPGQMVHKRDVFFCCRHFCRFEFCSR